MKERLHLATPGVFYQVKDKKRLKQLVDTGNFLWIKTVYEHHKWWEFWKIKKVVHYEVMCIKDLEI